MARMPQPAVLENFIGGRWTPSSASNHLDVTNPAKGVVIAKTPMSTATSDVDAAVKAAARDSFFGDLKVHGRDAFEFFTDKKVTISRW